MGVAVAWFIPDRRGPDYIETGAGPEGRAVDVEPLEACAASRARYARGDNYVDINGGRHN